jgi:hypothetical protein
VLDAALIVDLLALLTIIWVFRLVRHDRLYVGYGVIFVGVIVLGAVALTFPAVLGPLNALSRLSQRSAALVALTLAFVVLMLIYILSQLTLLSNRVTRLTQEIAIRDAVSKAIQGNASRSDDG